jgi:hypothetical protein
MKIDELNFTNLKKEILYFTEAIFTSSLIGYLILFLFENIREGFAGNYLNINHLLWVCLISGAILVLIKPEKLQKAKVLTVKDYTLMIFLGFCGGMIIWLKTKEMGYISYLLGLFSGILIILLSILLIAEDKTKK